MREINAAMGFDFAAISRPPCCAREIAEAVDRCNGRLLKGRDMECRRKMRQVMLDAVERRADGLARKCLFQESGEPRPGAAIANPVKHQIDAGAIDQEKLDLAKKVGAAVLVECDVLDIRQLDPCLAHAVS